MTDFSILQNAVGLCYCQSGPPFSRLLPIGPRAAPTNLHKLTLSIEAAYVVPAWGLHAVFFKSGIRCQRKPKL